MALLGCGSISAQETSKTVKGVVIDPNGNPVPGAEIRASRGDEFTNADVDGTYELEVPSKLKSVIITYPGYKKRKVRLDGSPFYVTEFKLARKKNRNAFIDLVGAPTITVNSEGFNSSDVQGHLGLMMGGTIKNWGWSTKIMLRVGGQVDFPNWDPEDSFQRSLYLMPMVTFGVLHKFSKVAGIFGGVGFGANVFASTTHANNGFASRLYYDVDMKLKPAIEIGGMINFTKNLNCIFGLTYMFGAEDSEGYSSNWQYTYTPGKNSGWMSPFVSIGYNFYPKR